MEANRSYTEVSAKEPFNRSMPKMVSISHEKPPRIPPRWFTYLEFEDGFHSFFFHVSQRCFVLA